MDRILTVRQPWASSIFRLGKDVENRSWPTSYRGRLWIHAATRMDSQGRGLVLPLGVVLGHVTLLDVVTGHSSPWAEPSHYHWLLVDPVELREPVAVEGRTGVRQFDPREHGIVLP